MESLSITGDRIARSSSFPFLLKLFRSRVIVTRYKNEYENRKLDSSDAPLKKAVKRLLPQLTLPQ